MKNKLKITLIVLGIAIIVFGAFIPTIFTKNQDTFTYNRKVITGYYYCHVYVTTEKDYSINEAVITLKNAFNEHDTLTKTVTYSEMDNALRKTEGDEYVYTITINLNSSEYFNYTIVDDVTLKTSIGTREVKAEESANFNWTILLMVFVILVGISVVVSGFAISFSSHLNNRGFELMQNAKDLSEKIKNSNVPAERICEYCSSTNSPDAKKCTNCGANLRNKK